MEKTTRRKLRWRRLALAVAGALVVVLLLRREIARMVLGRVLAGQGIAVESLTVSELGLGRCSLSAVRILHGIVSVEEVVADYDLAGLRQGRLRAVVARGLGLRWTGGEEPIDFRALLRHAPRDLEQAAAAIRAIGSLRLDGAVVEIATGSAFANLDATVDGSVEAAADGGLRLSLVSRASSPIGRFEGRLGAAIGAGGGLEGELEVGSASYRGAAAQAEAGSGRVVLRLTPQGELLARGFVTLGPSTLPDTGLELAGGVLALDLVDDRIDAWIEAAVAGADLGLSLRLAAHSLFSLPEIDLEIDASGRGPAALACLSLDAQAQSSIAAKLRLAGALVTPGRGTAWLDVARRLRPRLELEARGLRLRDLIESGDLTFAARIEEAGPALSLRLDRDAVARIERLGAGASRLPLSPPLLLRFPARDANVLELAPDPDGLRIEGPVSLELEDAREVRIGLSGSARMHDRAARGRFRLEADLPAFEVGSLCALGLRAQATLEIESEAGDLRLRLTEPAEVEIAALEHDSDPPQPIEVSPLRITGEVVVPAVGGFSGWLDLALQSWVLRASGVAAEGMALRLEQPASGAAWSGHLSAERVSASAEPPLLAPFAVEADLGPLDEPGGLVRATGSARVAGAPPLSFAGRIAADGSARVELDSGPIELRSGGLQPGQLLPRLAALRVLSGSARFAATIDLGEARPRGEARLTLDALDVEAGGVRVAGLDLELALDSLDPPASAAGQFLHVREVEAALGRAASDVNLCFQVLPGAPVRIAIEGFEARIPGGRVSARDLLLDPSQAEVSAVFVIERLDLVELFRRLEVEGLEGEGEVSGEVPVHLSGEQVSIAGAWLNSLKPGVLRYRSDRVRELLGGNGEWVDLMVEALRDFRYEVLEASVASASGQELKTRLKLRGHNPQVLDGHPLVVNIDVEGQLASLLAALGEGYRLKRELLWKSLRGRR